MSLRAAFGCWMLASLAIVSAQPESLSVGYAGGSGQSGAMFDVVASGDLRILALDLHLDPGFWDVELFTRVGSHAGVERDAREWTSLGTVQGLYGEGIGRGTRLPLDLCVAITSGSRQAFYVSCTNGPGLNYSSGSVVGAVAASDTHLTVQEGTGNAWSFGAVFQPRKWNGAVHYETGTGACTPIAAADPPPYQRNPQGYDFAVNEVRTDGHTRSTVSMCSGALTSFSVSAPAGAAWDVAYTTGTMTATGALTMSETQRIHLDISGPPIAWLFGGTFVQATQAPPIQLVDQPFLLPSSLAIQVLYDAPAEADGFLLSQGVELIPQPSSGQVIGPLVDDECLRLDLYAAPLCHGDVSFYGTRYRELWISSNGRVVFEGSDADWSPTLAEALSGRPFAGVWGDLNPAAGGAIITTRVGDVLGVEWRGVPPHLGGGSAASFRVAFDPTGVVTLEGVGTAGIAAGLVSWRAQAFLGVSAGGSGGATDAGATSFSLGGTGTPAFGTDMLYSIGQASGLLAGTGIAGIDFTPQSGGYRWTAR